MGHIIKSSVRNSPQLVPVEEASRNGKAVTEGNKLQDYFYQRRERVRYCVKNEVVCFPCPKDMICISFKGIKM